jgi:serine/threonine protein phosphatase PrpC
MINFIAVTDRGKVRENNEDSYYADEANKKYFILADGMGGHRAGEIASSTAVKIVNEKLSKEEIKDQDQLISLLKESVYKANEEILEMSLGKDEYRGMGTTLSLIYLYNDYLYYTNVGDSRIYEISDSIKRITKDDSFVNYLLEIGEINEEEAKNHPKKNVLTKALGTSDKLTVDVEEIAFNSANTYMLCSDGLTNMVSEEKILEIINNNDLETSAKKLLDLALENGGIDNITFILINVSR